MGMMYQVTPAIRVSSTGRMNLAKVRDGLPVCKCALRHLSQIGALSDDGQIKPEVLRAFNERWPR